MIAKLIGLLNVQRLFQQLQDRVELLTHRTVDSVKGEVKNLAITIGLATAGGLMALVTFVVALLGLYRFVAAGYGADLALAVIGAVTTILAALLFWLAATRGSKPKATSEVPPARVYVDPVAPAAAAATLAESPPVVPTSAAYAPVFSAADLHGPLAGIVAELMTRRTATGTPVDNVIEQVAREAALASGEAVDAAAELVRTGSRSVVYGTLAASLLAGWYLARKANNSET